MNNNEIITESLKLLDSNCEWEEIYAQYAQVLINNQKTYNDNRKSKEIDLTDIIENFYL